MINILSMLQLDRHVIGSVGREHGGCLTAVRVQAFPCFEMETKFTKSLTEYGQEFQKGL